MTHFTAYNPFTVLIKFNAVFNLTVLYLDTHTIVQCNRINHSAYRKTLPLIWSKPRFDKGLVGDALSVFHRFLDTLPLVRIATIQNIETLDLSVIEESLYDHVRPDFWLLLVRYIPNLKTLCLRGASFLSCDTFQGLEQYWKWPGVETLDISYCDHMNQAILMQLADALPALRSIVLDGLKCQISRGVDALSDRCDKLETISLKSCPTLSDNCLVSLAKFRKHHLRSLDLSGCRQITNKGLMLTAKYNIKLHTLLLANTSCSPEIVLEFVSGPLNRKYLRQLDISNCANLNGSQLIKVAEKLLESTEITHLTVSMFLISVMLSQALVSVNSNLVSLTVHGLPEGTPIQLIDRLIEIFPMLSEIVFVREYYQSDFLKGSYADTSLPKRERFITEENLTNLSIGSPPVKIILSNSCENVSSVGIDSW